MTDKIDTSAEAVAKLLDGVTPGPWTSNGHSCSFTINVGKHTGYQGRIADVQWWRDGHTGAKENPTKEQAKSNARFIAAARANWRSVAGTAPHQPAQGSRSSAESGGGSARPQAASSTRQVIRQVRITTRRCALQSRYVPISAAPCRPSAHRRGLAKLAAPSCTG